MRPSIPGSRQGTILRARLDRRDFLRGVAAAGAASWLARGAAEAAEPPTPPMRKMTIDLNCGAIGVSATLGETVDLASRHGFESFDPSPEALAGLAPAALDALLARMEERRLVFGAAGLPVDFRGDDARFEDGLRSLPALADGLKRAGVTRMGTWIAPGHAELTYRQNFARHASRLRRVASVLAERGVRLGLEYVGPKTLWSRSRYPFIHTLAEARELVAEIGADVAGLVLDSWHWYTARDTERDLLSLTGREVVAVDLNDAPAGKPIDEQIDSVRELPCATGVIDVATFLNALNCIGYDGPVRAEPFNAELRKLPREDAVARTSEAMRKAFARIV